MVLNESGYDDDCEYEDDADHEREDEVLEGESGSSANVSV